MEPLYEGRHDTTPGGEWGILATQRHETKSIQTTGWWLWEDCAKEFATTLTTNRVGQRLDVCVCGHGRQKEEDSTRYQESIHYKPSVNSSILWARSTAGLFCSVLMCGGPSIRRDSGARVDRDRPSRQPNGENYGTVCVLHTKNPSLVGTLACVFQSTDRLGCVFVEKDTNRSHGVVPGTVRLRSMVAILHGTLCCSCSIETRRLPLVYGKCFWGVTRVASWTVWFGSSFVSFPVVLHGGFVRLHQLPPRGVPPTPFDWCAPHFMAGRRAKNQERDTPVHSPDCSSERTRLAHDNGFCKKGPWLPSVSRRRLANDNHWDFVLSLSIRRGIIHPIRPPLLYSAMSQGNPCCRTWSLVSQLM